MIELLKEIILDFQELHLETGIPRCVDVMPVAGMATVCSRSKKKHNPPAVTLIPIEPSILTRPRQKRTQRIRRHQA